MIEGLWQPPLAQQRRAEPHRQRARRRIVRLDAVDLRPRHLQLHRGDAGGGADAQGDVRLDAGRDARRAGAARTIFSPRKAMDILGAPSALGRRSFNEEIGAMHILMTGAAGMIGRKLTARLVRDGALNGKPLTRLTLVDIVAPARPEFGGTVETVAADLTAPGAAEKLIAAKPDTIFHLAGVVSGEAETDFEKGYLVTSTAPGACSRPSARRRTTSPRWCSRRRSPSTARRSRPRGFPTIST